MDLIGALRCFVRVVETGSFSAVSRETNVSQSAVTRQIAQLEQHFGARLFHRTTRHLSLTDDGQGLLSHARHLLETADEMEAALGRQSSSPTGLVRLGLSVAGARFVASRIHILLARHPGLRVELVADDHLGDMIEGRLDLALRSGEIGDASLVARRIGQLGRAVVAAPIYLERYGAPAVPEDLTAHSCLIHNVGPEADVWRFTGPDGPHTVQVTGPLTANNSASINIAVRTGLGIALLPELQAIDDLRAGRFYRLLNDFPSQRLPVHIVYPSRRNLAPRTRVVMDFLVEQTRDTSSMLAAGAEVLT
jgi:DNA-binding transcriptional LysR family regulator